MLHIILLILKIIGWILLAILGIIVLLVCVVLFTPLRYRVQASCQGTLSTLAAGVDFTVFFRLVSGKVRYADSSLDWSLRIAWKKLGNIPEEEKQVERESEQEKLPVKETEESSTTTVSELSEERSTTTMPELSEERDATVVKVPQENSTPAVLEPQQESDEPAVTEPLRKTVTEPPQENKKPAFSKPTASKSSQKKEAGTDQKQRQNTEKESGGLWEKVSGVFEKIKYTFRQICDKIKELLRKKDILVGFVQNEAHKAAFFKVLTEAKKMIVRLKPKQISADIHFGFEDPSLTGQMLAGLSMLYPFTAESVHIRPDFENKVLDGNLYIKGHVRAVLFAGLLWNLLLDKNVRTTIRDIKNFSF